MAAALVLLAAVAVGVIAYFPGHFTAERPGRGALGARKRAPSAAVASSGADGSSQVPVAHTALDEPELEVLDLARATKAVRPALVILELRGEDGRPLREEQGVIVDTSGVVLTRFSPLLGAHQGICRLLHSRESRVEIVGLSYRDEALDLALLRVSHSPVGYPMVPLYPEVFRQDLRPGDPVFAVVDDRVVEASLSESYYLASDGISRMRLSEAPGVPPEAFLALDSYGFVLGLLKIEVSGRLASSRDGLRSARDQDYRLLVDVAASLYPAVERDTAMTLRELTRRRHEGTFADYSTRGLAAEKVERWRDAIELLEQALDRVVLDRPDDAEVAAVTKGLRESYLEEIRRLESAQRFEEASALADAAIARYPGDAAILLLMARARYGLANWSGGIQALLVARQTEPGSHMDALLEEGYQRLSQEASQAGDVRSQERSLLEGVRDLPQSASLHLELAKLYMRLEAYDDAIRLLGRVKDLSPALKETADNLLARIDDTLKRREAVIIPYASGSRSIRTDATVDGAQTVTFIIDTGATYTTIPSDVAQALGYDTVRARRVVNVSTVGGIIAAPMVQVESINVGGYSVRNLDVLVIPKTLGPDVGLLGLNFLKHFKYTVDSARNEFRLERP